MRTIIVVALLAVAACKGKDVAKPPLASTAPEGAETPGPAEAAGKVLDLAAATMIAEPGGVLSIDATGKVMREGKEVGTLSTAGEFTSAGALIATIALDGAVEIMGWGPGLQLSVRADGALLDHGEVALEPRPDGTLVGPLTETELKGVKLKVEGDKAGYRALMFAWLGVSKTDRF